MEGTVDIADSTVVGFNRDSIIGLYSGGHTWIE